MRITIMEKSKRSCCSSSRRLAKCCVLFPLLFAWQAALEIPLTEAFCPSTKITTTPLHTTRPSFSSVSSQLSLQPVGTQSSLSAGPPAPAAQVAAAAAASAAPARQQQSTTLLASTSARSISPRIHNFLATTTAGSLAILASVMLLVLPLQSAAWAATDDVTTVSTPTTQTTTMTTTPVTVQATGDAKKLFNEGRAYESQGNMAAAQRVYNKVTLISPRFVYGWSNLGNTQTALGDLAAADTSYTKAIGLCQESIQQADTAEGAAGIRKCNDLYILLLNRGSIRLNNGMTKEALDDLSRSDALRARPDAIVLQNLARAKELNGLYQGADRDYATAISMSSNEVNPFWLRAALVKFQLGDVKGAYDLFQRIENRFPEAPEVRAASAVFLAAKGDQIAGQRKFLEIPDRQRLKYSDMTYLTQTISWPPAMIDGVQAIAKAVGDDKR